LSKYAIAYAALQQAILARIQSLEGFEVTHMASVCGSAVSAKSKTLLAEVVER